MFPVSIYTIHQYYQSAQFLVKRYFRVHGMVFHNNMIHLISIPTTISVSFRITSSYFCYSPIPLISNFLLL